MTESNEVVDLIKLFAQATIDVIQDARMGLDDNENVVRLDMARTFKAASSSVDRILANTDSPAQAVQLCLLFAGRVIDDLCGSVNTDSVVVLQGLIDGADDYADEEG